MVAEIWALVISPFVDQWVALKKTPVLDYLFHKNKDLAKKGITQIICFMTFINLFQQCNMCMDSKLNYLFTQKCQQIENDSPRSNFSQQN